MPRAPQPTSLARRPRHYDAEQSRTIGPTHAPDAHHDRELGASQECSKTAGDRKGSKKKGKKQENQISLGLWNMVNAEFRLPRHSD